MVKCCHNIFLKMLKTLSQYCGQIFWKYITLKTTFKANVLLPSQAVVATLYFEVILHTLHTFLLCYFFQSKHGCKSVSIRIMDLLQYNKQWLSYLDWLTLNIQRIFPCTSPLAFHDKTSFFTSLNTNLCYLYYWFLLTHVQVIWKIIPKMSCN